MNKFKSLLLASAALGTVAISPSVMADSRDASAIKTDFNTSSKTFDVTVTKATNGKLIKSIDVAIWSEENGQDDIKWYSSSAISNGQARVQFNLNNHSNRAGNYNTHTYVNYTDGSRSGHVLPMTKINPTAPRLTLSGGNIQMVSDIVAPSDGSLMTAIWSDENGQDDIKWYTADNSGRATAALSNHKGYGTYHAHTYMSQNGKMTGISGQTLDIPKPSISSQITKISETTYDLLINNVPDYITSISVPTWSEVNDQDDIKWYQAQKVGNGSYKVTIPLTNHGFDYGKYVVHIYGQNSLTGKFEGIGANGFTVSQINGLTNPTVSITNANQSNGTFTVSVLETTMSKRVTGIKAQITSKSNAALTKTYEAKISSYGKASVSVDLKSINSSADTFSVLATVLYSDDTTASFNLADQAYKPQATNSTQVAGTPKITTYINETNTYPVGQCTWGVKSLAPWIPNYLGNANMWAINARAKGFRTGTTPRVGAIIVWPNDGGGYGHVAYVTHVESPTRIQVKEANYAGKQYIANFRGWFNPLDSFWKGNVSYIYPD